MGMREAADALAARNAPSDDAPPKTARGDIRVLWLPPMTVAYIANGERADGEAEEVFRGYIEEAALRGAREFAVTGPNGETERWVPLPEDLPVRAPLAKRRFDGGMYAARFASAEDREDGWRTLRDWLARSESFLARQEADCGARGRLTARRLGAGGWKGPTEMLLPVMPRLAVRTRHPQERVIDSYAYNGVSVDLVEWGPTVWCGKIGYANDNASEPDVESVQKGFASLDTSTAVNRLEDSWDVCVSLNYLSASRPNGVMIGFLVGANEQPEEFDVYRASAGRYMRISLEEEAAFAVGDAPWSAGIPPYQWIGEQVAPAFGYEYGEDGTPIFEYYGYYNPEKGAHECRLLYVPVRPRTLEGGGPERYTTA